MSYIALELTDLAWAALLVLIHAGLSLALQLGLGRQILVATVRMIAQLALLGLVLEALFSVTSPLWTGLAALVMILFAGREAVARQARKLAGLWSYGIGTGAMLIAATIVTTLALTTQVQPDPWYAARYAIPLLGMILGNTMTGVSLGLHTLTTTARRERTAIEAQLALGADRWTAFRPVLRDAMRSGLIPIINSMAATGLVFIPGMMTGQILAGADPADAIKYQLLIMFLIAGATGIGVFSAVYAGAARLSDARHRLRLDRLAAAKEDAPKR
ncbi:MAG: iron export ABC transporter permease subunit FetB [Alphaproteobacteria bacterium]|nr:iron export ABC transporter permease subunit FetB [Alphaproteobacteria bacterium]